MDVLAANLDGVADLHGAIPAALLRAELYEQRGEREKAIRNYGWLSDLLEGCDPELQPQRELARRALEQLLAESP